MKKVLLSMVAVATIAMTSCGGDPMCECFEAEAEMRKQVEAAGEDEAKIKEIKESFKAQEETCEKLGDKMREEMKDATPEDVKKKMEEFSESCPAAKEAMGH